MSEVTVRGAVVRTAFSNGLFWERLIVGADAVTLKPWLRRGTRIGRPDVEAVEFVKVRLPFVWKTLIRFRLRNGSVMRRKFVAVRTNRARAALGNLGWPVRDLNWRADAVERLADRRRS
jgi:hypothetical protein